MRCIKQVVIGFCFFCVGCTSQENRSSVIVPTVKIDPGSDKQTGKIDDFFSFSHFVFLETTDESLFGKTDKVQIMNDRIYVMDEITMAVYVFDANGRFLRKLNKRGHASNEYTVINDMEVLPDGTLSLYDGMQGVIFQYDTLGLFKSRRNVAKGESIKHLSQGRVAVNLAHGASDDTETSGHCNYLCYDEDGIVDRAIPFNPALLGRRFSHGEGKSVFYNYDGTIYMSSQLNDTIYSVAMDGTLHPFMAFDFGHTRPAPGDAPERVADHLHKIRAGEEVSTPYGFYKFGKYTLIMYSYNNKRYMALADSTSIIYTGLAGRDSNGLSFNPVPYDGFDAQNALISLIPTTNLDAWLTRASEKGSDTALLKELTQRVKVGDNPVLAFYTWKDDL